MATASEQRARAATPPDRHASRAQWATRSFRFRLTAAFVGLLAIAAGLVLLFVNAAAHLATIPVENIEMPDPVSGFVVNHRVVDLAEAQAQAETLSRLRFFSILGFVALILGGMALASYVAGRALQPVAQMAAVARRISGRNLKERIAMEGPDDELKQLADAFDDMVARLDSAFEQQRRFVADASHELRTPLTALQVTLDEVRSDPHAGPDDYRRLAGDVSAATERMRRLVEDLLELAEAERPPVTTPVSLSSLADSVVDEMEPLAARRGVLLASVVPAGLVVAGEQLALRRALTNLVENGIRYNHEGGHVMVEHAAAPPGYVAVAVRDDGIGIPAEAQPRIFDRFYRIDPSRSRAEGGSGLGLSIVAKIAADHGGTVEVESRPGEGSRFVLTLPVPVPAAAEQEAGPAAS